MLNAWLKINGKLSPVFLVIKGDAVDVYHIASRRWFEGEVIRKAPPRSRPNRQRLPLSNAVGHGCRARSAGRSERVRTTR
jgi:hypothetical protein